MEKNKETVKKSCSDFYPSKNIGVAKTDSPHFSIRSGPGRYRSSYVSQSKTIPINKRCNFYENEAKSFFKNCEKCFHARPHIVVNSPCNIPQIDSGHDLNGNVPYNAYPICNLTSLVNYQSNQHYEISLSKCKSFKPRAVYSDQKSFNSKISNPTFSTNKFYSPMPNSVRCRCSKSFPSKYPCSNCYLKITDNPLPNTVSLNEKYHPKYNVRCTFSEQALPTNEVKLSDLPVFVHSNLQKDPCLPSVADYSENQVQKRKPFKRWDQISNSQGTINSKKYNDAEKMMLFPALPTNNHCQQIKINSSCTNSMPPSEISLENPSLDNVLASSGTVNLSSIAVTVPSTIPQASYADVIRMSATCSGGVQSYVALEIDKSLNSEQNQVPLASMQEKVKENPQPNSSDWVILRLSQIDLNSPNSISNASVANSNQNGQNLVAPRPIVVSLEKPSFYNSSMSTCKSVLNALSCLPEKKEELESLAADSLCNSDKSSADNSSVSGSTNRSSVSSDLTTSITETQFSGTKTDSVYSSPSSVGSFDAFKPNENKDLNMDGLVKREPPVIILNSSPHDNFSEISFGIEYDEMLKLCSDSSSVLESNIPLSVKDSNEDSFSDNINIVDPHLDFPPDNISTSNPVETDISPNESISVNGKHLHWKESEIQFDSCNHTQLAEYFTGIWNELGHDQTDPSQISEVQYYHEL